MRFIDINALKSVNNKSRTGNSAQWKGDDSYPLTLDPAAVVAITPYRGYADATAPETDVDGFFTMTLATGQEFHMDATARDTVVAAKNAA